jgi:hypothetical protein
MSKLRRDLKSDTIPNKTTRGAQIITACAGNTDIGDVTAPLTAFTAANTGLAQAAANLQAAQAEVARLVGVQGAAETTWNTTHENLLVAIENNTGGNAAKMGTTTVDTYDPGRGAPAAPPAQPTSVAVTLGDLPGELEVTWNAGRPRPRLYIVRMCEDPYAPDKMQQVGMPSGSRFVKDGLTAGKKYWFDVTAVGSGGQQGPPSDPAQGMAM